MNCAQILVVRTLDRAQFLLHAALFPILAGTLSMCSCDPHLKMY